MPLQVLLRLLISATSPSWMRCRTRTQQRRLNLWLCETMMGAAPCAMKASAGVCQPLSSRGYYSSAACSTSIQATTARRPRAPIRRRPRAAYPLRQALRRRAQRPRHLRRLANIPEEQWEGLRYGGAFIFGWPSTRRAQLLKRADDIPDSCSWASSAS